MGNADQKGTTPASHQATADDGHSMGTTPERHEAVKMSGDSSGNAAENTGLAEEQLTKRQLWMQISDVSTAAEETKELMDSTQLERAVNQAGYQDAEHQKAIWRAQI